MLICKTVLLAMKKKVLTLIPLWWEVFLQVWLEICPAVPQLQPWNKNLENLWWWKWNRIHKKHCRLKKQSHWNISLSLCSFSYKGVCFDKLKLSVSDVIVSLKGSNGDGKLHFFGQVFNCHNEFCNGLHELVLSGHKEQRFPPFYAI